MMRVVVAVIALSLATGAIPTDASDQSTPTDPRGMSLDAKALVASAGRDSSDGFNVFYTLGATCSGPCESASFRMWSGTINTPVESSMYAVWQEDGWVQLRWTLPEDSNYAQLGLYRSADGDWELLANWGPEWHSSGSHKDHTTWPGQRFTYELRGTRPDLSEFRVAGPCEVVTPGSTSLALRSPFPNPASGDVSLRVDVPSPGCGIRLMVVDTAGREVRTVVDGYQRGGRLTTSWDRTNAQGEKVASGIYFLRLEARGEVRSAKIVLLK
ncbi:T9SS type A sorting domain-containing protein [bacterium]|nr:T9SS type A sorting domain-containing protein [bacterium]